ncbi:MAG: hypothetical protein H6838_18480 [Planctomycetes bacterium]|nr:hypothetical protein [Planctomycetota bacterium]
MHRLLLLVAFFVAALGFNAAAMASGGGTYSATATAKIDNPGTITVSSNGGQINNVVVKLNGVLLTEGTGYTKTIDGSRVTINFIDQVDQDDEAEISGQCSTSGAHDGELHNSDNWDLQ